MKRILFIKFTSLGDLIHALPALTDASRVYPNLKIDWMIDEGFSEIAKWHQAVDQVFTTSHRVWRKGLLAAIRPIFRLIQTVRRTEYDLIIDGQGNFKTALMSLFMRGKTAGFDRRSVREWIASFAYQKKYPASKSVHAIERLRQLFSLSLGYPYPSTPPDFGIDQTRFPPFMTELPHRYLVFIHSASWKTKLWPEEYGVRLLQLIGQRGYPVFLPWGNQEEHDRSQRLAANSRAIVLPKLSLSAIGALLARAAACVSVDTGLSHLAAALNIPSITLYGSTDAGLTGANGKNQLHLQSKLPCSPCKRKICCHPSQSPLFPPCFAQLTPEMVLQHLLHILK